MKEIDPNTFSIIACIIGYSLAEKLDIYEQVSLGNWLELLGQYLQTSSSQQSLINNKNKKVNNNNDINDEKEDNKTMSFESHIKYLNKSMNLIIKIIDEIKNKTVI